MKIAIFSDTFAPQANGVAGVAAQSAAILASRGHDVRVITVSGERIEVLRELADGRYTIHRVPSVPFWGVKGLRVALLHIPIRRILGEWQPDIVHTHTLFEIGNLAVRTARRYKVPIVGTHHTFFNHYLKYVYLDYAWAQQLTWQYTISFYNRCDRIISPSHALADELIEHGLKPKVEILANPIDTTMYHPKSTVIRPDTAIFVGRLGYEKSVDQVIRAFALVVAQRPAAKLTIVGDGPERPGLEKLCREFGIRSNVRFAGLRRYKTVSRILRRSQLFVTASKTENMPLTVLEALATGLPVVAVRAKGNPELVKDGVNGRLVPPDNPPKMAAAILDLMTHPSLLQRLSEGAREGALTYSPEQITDRLEALYKEAIKHHHG